MKRKKVSGLLVVLKILVITAVLALQSYTFHYVYYYESEFYFMTYDESYLDDDYEYVSDVKRIRYNCCSTFPNGKYTVYYYINNKIVHVFATEEEIEVIKEEMNEYGIEVEKHLEIYGPILGLAFFVGLMMPIRKKEG